MSTPIVYPTNSTALDRTASDFYSGLLFGWQKADLKANMDVCFPDDPELGKMIGDYIQLMKEGKQDEGKQLFEEMQSKRKADLEDCLADKDLTDAWDTLQKAYDDFIAQENFEAIIGQNYLDNKDAIDGFTAQMFLAWDAEMYYQAGKLVGLVDGYLYAM